MPTRPGHVNRGPAAADGNRRAIVAAARTLFAERGYHVPLSAIAKAAEVGQGVFYRHFPTRLDLAFAVFEDNFAELEALSADEDPAGFARLWSRMLDLIVEASAFVEMVLDARRNLPAYDGDARLLALVDASLHRAQQAGLTDPALTPDDVLVTLRMAFGIVVTTAEPAGARAAVDRALTLVRWFPAG
jgi:AcrR family transcriptional regulator